MIDAFLTGMAALGYFDHETADFTFRFADAERFGLIANASHPGGNVTGITPYIDHLPAKQLQLALELMPAARRIGLVGNRNDPKVPHQLSEIEAVARRHGLGIVRPDMSSPDDLPSVLDRLAAEAVDIVIVLQTSLTFAERRRLASGFAAQRLPAIYGYREHVEDGGLLSYGVDLRWCFRRGATLVHKILTGTPPGDIPVEFPTRVKLVVNARTARALGFEIPVALLAAADDIID